jgi:signal transduction histidine kinase
MSNLSFVESMITDRDEDLRLAVSDCNVAAKMMLHMANNLSMIARLEAGDRAEPTEIEVAELVRGCVARAGELAGLGSIGVKIDGELPAHQGRWEIPVVELILDNLILCSVQCTRPGGQVDVGAATIDGKVRIQVLDDGPPVRDEYRGRLFEREFQVEAKSTPGARYARALGLYAVGLAAQSVGAVVAIGATGEGRVELTVELPA